MRIILFFKSIPDRAMKRPYNESGHVTSINRKWERAEIAKLVQDFESRGQAVSQRDFSKKQWYCSLNTSVLGRPKK